MSKKNWGYKTDVYEQAKVWRETIEVCKVKKRTIRKIFSEIEEVIFTGCGSAYNVAISAVPIYRQIVGKRAMVVHPSEIFQFPSTVFDKRSRSLLILISRSGETTEVLKALSVASQKKIKTLAITCYENSKLAQGSTEAIVISSSAERSITTTKSVTAMFVVVQLISAFVSGDNNYYRELERLPDVGEKIIQKYDELCRKIGENTNINKLAFLGNGPYFGLARECQLKVKETTLLPSDAYHCLEFRHGPRSTVDKNMLVTILMSDSGRKEETDLLKEMKFLGGKTLTICERINPQIQKKSDYLVEINSGLSEFVRCVLYMPVVHFLAYYKTLSLGKDPDHPKGIERYVKI